LFAAGEGEIPDTLPNGIMFINRPTFLHMDKKKVTQPLYEKEKDREF
jgi:hypothetical protein